MYATHPRKTDSLLIHNGTHMCNSADRKPSFILQEITLFSLSAQTHILQHTLAVGRGDARRESILKMSQADRTVTLNSHIYLQTIPTQLYT